MARRMFSTDIVGSDPFLDMGQGAQVLYFHLAMKADDDGFVNPKSMMRMLGIADDELKVLLAKRFLLPFESGVVVVKHWLIHNLIRADLYKETQYKKEKSMLGLNENGAYTELREGVAEIKQIEAPKWLKQRRKEQRTADVPQTALRIGKDRLGKDSKDSIVRTLKPSKKEKLNSTYESMFEDFWKIYPEKVAKGKAYEVWQLLEENIKTDCITAITNQVASKHFYKDWLKKDSVPHPTTWLNQRRWEDVVVAKKPEKGEHNALITDHTQRLIDNARSKTIKLT